MWSRDALIPRHTELQNWSMVGVMKSGRSVTFTIMDMASLKWKRINIFGMRVSIFVFLSTNKLVFRLRNGRA
jgi:hypothetical protein